MLLTCFLKGVYMKDWIFVISYVLLSLLCCVFVAVVLRNSKKFKTTRYFRVCRNLCIAICISAFICSICLPSFSFLNLFFPIATVLIFFISANSYHKSIAMAKEFEIRIEKYLKYQPIDAEYKDLD